MAANSFRVFVSATTRDLGSYRKAVAASLDHAGCHVEVQEDFTAHSGKFLQKLRDYIETCDLVICLVGDHFGWQPPDGGLIPSPARDAYSEPLVSATEWEYFLAVDCGREIFLYLSADGFAPDTTSDDTAEKAAAHQRFRQHVEHAGRDANRFSDADGLAKNILEAFHLRALRRDGVHRPRVLPKAAQHFTGRAADIEWVKARLSSERRVALIGPGGIGKTAIAHEAVAALSPNDAPFAHFPGGIFLHDFYAAPGHLAAIEDIVAQARLIDLDEREREPRARALLSGSRGLVYLEGCEKADDLPRFLDLCGPATVLITSRREADGKGAAVRDIPPLVQAEAAEMLRRHAAGAAAREPDALPGKEHAVWREIAVLLGRHALALRLAGHRLGTGNETPAEFRDLLLVEGFEHFDDDRRTKESLDLLFTHSAEILSPESRGAWFALVLHALAPINIAPIASALNSGETITRKALNDLVQHSIADAVRIASKSAGETEPAWMLSHALLSEWGKKRLEAFAVNVTAIRGQWIMWWADFIDCCFESARVPGGEQRYLAISEHLDAVLENIASEFGATSHMITIVLNRIGALHRSMGRYSTAERCYRRDLAIAESILGPEHPETLISLNSLAIVLQHRGDWDAAERIFRRVLADREITLGPMHAATLESLNNIATLLQAKGDLAGAQVLHQRAMEACDRTLGPEHPATLRSVSNFATLLYSEGELAAAELLCRRALDARERTLGPDHAETLQSLNSLAVVLQEKGDLTSAEALYRRALDARERTLGAERPDTLNNLNNLAGLLFMRGDLANAEPVFRRALEAHERTLGAEHPNTLIIALNLARLLAWRGDLAAVEPLARRAVERYRKLLLPQHAWRKYAEELLSQIQHPQRI